MGSSYSDLNLYFKLKTGTYGIPKSEQANGEQQNNNNQKYSVSVKNENYQGCVNFEKVTHTIEFKPPNKGTNYNIILCEGEEGKKGKNVFGYYYPSDDKEVLKELHVYYSVLAPNDPLIVSFFTHAEQTYNFLYSGLLSTRWVRAYSISYYSLSESLTTKLLTKEFKNLRKNRKIKFVTGKNVVQVTGFKQDLEKDKIYRYIYYPTGDKSVLGSECVYVLNSNIPKTLECPEPSEPAKSSEDPKTAATPAKSDAKTNSTPNYDNKIDPYYLDFVKNHFFDGVILYFVIDDKNQGQNSTASGGAGSSGQASSTENNNGNSGTSRQSSGNGDGKGHKDNYDKNMAVILELIDNCNTKTHIKRKDKHGNYWSQEEVKYNTDKELIKELNSIKDSAKNEDSTTFILEKKTEYKGVNVSSGDSKTTYTKYTHTATATNIKTNLLFQKGVTQIGKYDPSKDKTISLDVYFLKFGGTEENWPFILMFTYQNEDKTAKPAEAPQTSNGAAGEQQQQQQQQQPPQAQVASGGAASPSPSPESKKKECKKCYFSSENYDFTKWLELTVGKKPEPKDEKTKKEKQEDSGQELENKLKERLDKIEEYGKCTKDINILRSIAYQVLTGKDEPDTSKSADPEPPEGRPEIKRFRGDIGGISLKVVLGSVAGGLVVLGTIGAIIYGIYWYNTTIKLLT